MGYRIVMITSDSEQTVFDVISRHIQFLITYLESFHLVLWLSALRSSGRHLSMQLDVDFYRDRLTVTHLMIKLSTFQTEICDPTTNILFTLSSQFHEDFMSDIIKH